MHEANLLDAKNATLRIRALSSRFDNSNTDAESCVVDHLTADRPAFWSTGRQTTAGIFLPVLASLMTIEESITECERFYGEQNGKWRSPTLLDQLLPLNNEAVRELQKAYRAAGTFRNAEELFARTAKAEPTPVSHPVDVEAQQHVEHAQGEAA